ncbi:sporulation specific protein Spo13 [Schizosaccharomyces japonicus yFS275]|uniref:Sporulation specific protein Spo13 n=1 Tax=Schizosaccharomyces japonicus (strain yFS275 / FY16936) TaxID=402676 RepID=B6K2R3_SCHJY|nr:sporulation specific protein Spo13 [Schizosaccharomyces japonicus yFS275]EEB07444.1 sporulation specific protein Spo13 [Schizosaccharomyces japonicus yFS275]
MNQYKKSSNVLGVSSNVMDLGENATAPLMEVGNKIEYAALVQQLNEERARRIEIERTLVQTQKELEDLSVSLFSEANNMVAKVKKENQILKQELMYYQKRDLERNALLKNIQLAVRSAADSRKYLAVYSPNE